MQWMKTTALTVTALGLVAFFSADAAAQAPVLTATANGGAVTIDWTSVPGATGYTVQAGTSSGAADIASVNLPATITHIVGAAPNGAYFLRVRATATGITGPFSNEVALLVGGPPPGPCTGAPEAPSVTALARGATVLVAWNQVAGAAGYRVEYSRTPTGTDMVHVVNGGTTSENTFVGMLGTFFTRVVAGNSCGQTASQTVEFAITDLASGPGPRTPDPPPGGILPLPSYGAAVVQNAGRAYAADLARHSGPNCKGELTWLFKLLRDLRQQDSRWGLNWKRGWGTELSTDIITYNGTSAPDTVATHIYLVDVLSGECESNIPVWNTATTAETWSANARYPGLCANGDCAKWTIAPYLAAGYPADPRQQ